MNFERLPDPSDAPPEIAPAEQADSLLDDRSAGPETQDGIEHRRERIYLETSRHRVEGFLTVAREGYRSRMSDVLNASERDFLTLTDATVEELDGGRPPHRHRFIAIARRHIVLAIAVSESS